MSQQLLDSEAVGALPPAGAKFILTAYLATPHVHLAHSFHPQQTAPGRNTGTSAVAPKR